MALKQAGLDCYLVDIGQNSPVDADFLSADVLIVNITSKNIAAFRHLVAAIVQSPIDKVLFVSSTSVYQNLNREVCEDEGAENPDSPLFQIEQLFRQSTAFDTTVLRFAGLVGKGRHPGRFFRGGKTLSQAQAPVNLIHLDDCIGIIEAILAQSAWGQVFNGCSSTHPSKHTFYHHAARQAGFPPVDFVEDAAPSFKLVANHKLKRLLNYQFQHPDLMQLKQEHYD